MRGTQMYTSTEYPVTPYIISAELRHPDRDLSPHTRQLPSSINEELIPIQLVSDSTSLWTYVHTIYTQRTLDSAKPNSLLGTRPPPIDPALEQHLPCTAPLWPPHITSHRHRIGFSPDASCAVCQNAEGTVEHVLLHCSALQSHRDAHHIQAHDQLWECPGDVLEFFRDASVL